MVSHGFPKYFPTTNNWRTIPPTITGTTDFDVLEVVGLEVHDACGKGLRAPMPLCQHPPSSHYCLMIHCRWDCCDLFMLFGVLRRLISLPQSCKRSLSSLCGRLSEFADVFWGGGVVCPCSSFVHDAMTGRLLHFVVVLGTPCHLVPPSVKGHGTTTESCSLLRGTICTSTSHSTSLNRASYPCLWVLTLTVDRCAMQPKKHVTICLMIL